MPHERVADRADPGVELHGALERVARRVDALEAPLEDLRPLDVQPRREGRLGVVRVGHPHQVRRERLPFAPRRAGRDRARHELRLEALEGAGVARCQRERLLPGRHRVGPAVAGRLEQPGLGDEQLDLVRVGRRRGDLVLHVSKHRGQGGAPVLHATQERVRSRRGRVDLHRGLGVRGGALLVAQDRLAGDGELDLDAGDAHLVPGHLEHGRARLEQVDERPRVGHVRQEADGRGLGRPRRAARQGRRALARRGRP